MIRSCSIRSQAWFAAPGGFEFNPRMNTSTLLVLVLEKAKSRTRNENEDDGI
jgi:hypothetical protein